MRAPAGLNVPFTVVFVVVGDQVKGALQVVAARRVAEKSLVAVRVHRARGDGAAQVINQRGADQLPLIND